MKMKYFFVFEKSQEEIPTLIVYRDDGMILFGTPPKVVKVFTGERATQLFNELLGKALEANNEKDNSSM